MLHIWNLQSIVRGSASVTIPGWTSSLRPSDLTDVYPRPADPDRQVFHPGGPKQGTHLEEGATSFLPSSRQ